MPVSTGVNVGSANSGAIDDTGLLTLRESGDGQRLRTYDLNDLTLPPTVVPTSWTSTADFAYNPVNDRLYSVLSTGEVVRVNLTTGNRVAVSVPGDTLPATLYGGQFFDADGNFFAYANTGGFCRIEIGNGNGTGASPAADVTLVSDAAISGSNDGASCPAPPPSAAPGVAKNMTVAGNGPWDVTITYTTENLGDDILSAVSMTDDLTAVFGTEGTDWSLTSVSATGPTSFSANASFDGETAGDIQIIGADSELLPGETGVIEAVIQLNTPGTYQNAVTLIGESKLTGTPTTDDSVSGTNADPNDDDDPSESGPAEITVGPDPDYDLEITKTDNLVDVRAGGTTTYVIVATNNGPDPIDVVNVADTFPADGDDFNGVSSCGSEVR